MSTKQQEPTGSMPLRRQTILLVDDEAAILALLADVLEDAGYTVLTASNGRAALTLAYQQRPDLVVTDLMMPHMDGLALCKALRASSETAQIPVLGDERRRYNGAERSLHWLRGQTLQSR